MFEITPETLLLYLPVLAFLGILWAYRKKAKKFEFDIVAGIAIFGVATKIGVQFFLDRSELIPSLALIAGGLVMFVGLVFAVGDRLSGETTLTISAALALSPWFSGIIAFAIAMLALVIKLALATMKTLNMDSKTLARDVAFQTGLGTGIIPSLRDMEVATEGERTTVVPVFFFVYLIVAIVVTVGAF